MANHSLPHVNTNSYHKIGSKDLENIHLKLNQAHAVLSLLSEWIAEVPSVSLSLKQIGMIDFTVFLVLAVMEQITGLLPEV